MIEYDVDKGAENQRRRGLPFAAAEALFGGPLVGEEEAREDDGEVRFIATGPLRCFPTGSSSWYALGMGVSGVSSVPGKPMSEKFENFRQVSREEAARIAKE